MAQLSNRLVRWGIHLLVALLLVAGCEVPARPAASVSVQPLVGQVSFPGRATQATMTDVANAATVSLINCATNQTVSSTVTNSSGNFVLTFSYGFKPDASASYYLEAVKGLSSNLPGYNAARVRTIAQYQTGWVTITNRIANVGIVVDTSTTALSIGAGLKAGTATPVTFSDLIGSLSENPTTYVPVTNLSQSDYSTILGYVNTLLSNNQDPLAGVGYVPPSTWVQLNSTSGLTVTGVSPSTGSVGTTVTVSGTGFLSPASGNIVTFNGATASVSAGSATSLTVTVPEGASPGKVSVTAGSGTAVGPTFTVTGVVPGGVLVAN